MIDPSVNSKAVRPLLDGETISAPINANAMALLWFRIFSRKSPPSESVPCKRILISSGYGMQCLKSIFINVFLINMSYEHSFISGKKISSFGRSIADIFTFFCDK